MKSIYKSLNDCFSMCFCLAHIASMAEIVTIMRIKNDEMAL